jgi:predicted anti-sigma-YlaC factor YlaD
MTCDRAGELISVRLDGELSQLEGVALDRHLESCPVCRTLESELASLAQLLREAPYVEPDALELTAPPAALARARLLGRATAVASFAGAAAVAAVLVVSTTQKSSTSSAALGFRSVAEQVRFVNTEQQRIEPPRVDASFTVSPRVAVRSL